LKDSDTMGLPCFAFGMRVFVIGATRHTYGGAIGMNLTNFTASGMRWLKFSMKLMSMLQVDSIRPKFDGHN
jgi:hypothetical protein